MSIHFRLLRWLPWKKIAAGALSAGVLSGTGLAITALFSDKPLTELSAKPLDNIRSVVNSARDTVIERIKEVGRQAVSATNSVSTQYGFPIRRNGSSPDIAASDSRIGFDHFAPGAGAPVMSAEVAVVSSSAHTSAVLASTRLPAWTAFMIPSFTAAQAKSAPARLDEFFADDRIPPAFRLQPDALRHSGYDRGHMAPNMAIAAAFGRKAQTETFYMSNVIPQAPSLNAGVWQRLEQIEALDYARRYQRVWVVCGPVFAQWDGRKIGAGVPLPPACFRVIARERRDGNGVDTLCFIVPQDAPKDANPILYLVSLAQVEQSTGIRLFPGLFQRSLSPYNNDSTYNNAARRLW